MRPARCQNLVARGLREGSGRRCFHRTARALAGLEVLGAHMAEWRGLLQRVLSLVGVEGVTERRGVRRERLGHRCRRDG